MKRSTRENERFAIGLIGTYPPTRCGIATFTASLATAMSSVDPRCSCPVVRSTDGSSGNADGAAVVATLLPGSTASRAAAISTIDTFDVVVLQHEFGIYGGADGLEVLDIVDHVEVPVIVVLHTVPQRATSTQKRIIEHLAAAAARVVVQSAAAYEVLVDLFDVEPEKVQVIPHGATLNLAAEKPGREASNPATMLTWGLLGPDKGIEFGIQALAFLRPFEPMPRYVVVGQTHPRILATEGERYRRSLQATAVSLGVDSKVDFDNAYHDTRSLLRLVREADIVLLPYRSREQVVSGVLVEALAAGRPVIATRFPHAIELLGEGSGILVPHDDPAAIAAAIRLLLTRPAFAARARAVARKQAQSLAWEAVGKQYVDLAVGVLRNSRRVTGAVSGAAL
jgi:glycosyltransferase involved in cell wall biosynthesis